MLFFRKFWEILIIIFVLLLNTVVAANTPLEIQLYLDGIKSHKATSIVEEKIVQPMQLAEIYEGRNHVPLWVEGGSLCKQTEMLLAAIKESGDHGFNSSRYHYEKLAEALKNPGFIPNYALDILLTDALLSQIKDRSVGVIDKVAAKVNLFYQRRVSQEKEILYEIVEQPRSMYSVLQSLWPNSAEYEKLVQYRHTLKTLPSTASTLIPSGKILKPGMQDDRIGLLKNRLLGPAEHSNLYDEDLEVAVIAFQKASGLEFDGIVGPATLEELNTTHVGWIDRIDANLERLRWLPRDTPIKYIKVNTADFSLKAVVANEDVVTMKVIVGSRYRQTPIFTETIKYLVVHPYWYVPRKLAINDKLPLLQEDPKLMASLGYEARMPGAGEFSPVNYFSWLNVTPLNFNYHIRQRPGSYNALGKIKFMLPNQFEVYLHDTPDKKLFDKQERIFSSGCIRLEDAKALAIWLLSEDANVAADNFELILSSKTTQTIYLNTPVPVYILYFTAFTNSHGEVIFRRDIYGRDEAIVKSLHKDSLN